MKNLKRKNGKTAFTFAEVFSGHCAGKRKAAFTLAEVLSGHCAGKRKAAFTLAEVLITLGIIGVVAAITMPTLISNHQKQSYVTGLKKAINVSQNMLRKMQADEEVSSLADTELFREALCNENFDYTYDYVNKNGCEDFYGNPSVIKRIVPKYLNVVKTCEFYNCDRKYQKATLSYNYSTYALSSYVVDSNTSTVIEDLFSGLIDKLWRMVYIGFYTADGMIYYIAPLGSGGWDGFAFIVDINGEKGPNIYGRDIFAYTILSNGKIYTDNYRNPVGYLLHNNFKMDY